MAIYRGDWLLINSAPEPSSLAISCERLGVGDKRLGDKRLGDKRLGDKRLGEGWAM